MGVVATVIKHRSPLNPKPVLAPRRTLERRRLEPRKAFVGELGSQAPGDWEQGLRADQHDDETVWVHELLCHFVL